MRTSAGVDRAPSPAGPDIAIALPFDLIQVLRLAHALVEAGCRLHVSPEDAGKLSRLRTVFGMEYRVGDERVPVVPGLAIDHMRPETRIGSITRSIVLPIGAFEYCRSRWPERRPVRASFSGLPSEGRKEAINDWLKLSGLRLRVPGERGLASRITRRVARELGFPARDHVCSEGVRLSFSSEGRQFPGKAWNVGYYASLLESEFVLCPDGDFGREGVVWTYRFIESLLCGAIPVVQHDCELYAGFRFRSMSEPLGDLEWSREDARHNFDLALKRFTVPAEVIRSEVIRLLSLGPPALEMRPAVIGN